MCRWSQLKIVLLGGRNSGKTSVGNMILGAEEFVTRETTSFCRRLGVQRGRRLMVVDAPGWWCDSGVRDSCELVKQEIMCSVPACSPGPHVLLVVVKAGSAFSEKRRLALEEHVALLGEGAWLHCVTVFTFKDQRRLIKAEELVKRGGAGLRWLSNKCGGRCHSVVFGDDAQLEELMEKMETLVVTNGNQEFQLQARLQQEVAERRRRAEEGSELRLAKVKEQRAQMRDRLQPMSDIRIVLVGAKASGKTSTFNTILGRVDAPAPSRTSRCRSAEGMVFGRRVTVVDTPGWWRNYLVQETSAWERRELVLGAALCPPGPHVFLLVVRLDRAFTRINRRTAQEHLELLGHAVWPQVLLVFSFGDWLGSTPAECYLETEGAELQWLVERCNNRYHVINNRTRGDGFQVCQLIRKIEETVAGGNRKWHYEVERTVMEALEMRKRRERERAVLRRKKREEQRRKGRTLTEKLRPLSELRLFLVGGSKSGKSSCGNTILGARHFPVDAQSTAACVQKQGGVNRLMLMVTDTPAVFSVTSDLLRHPGTAVLLVVNASAAFRDVHMEAVERQLERGGAEAWRRALVLFSFGDWLGDVSVEERIESEGGALQRLVERCGNRYHVVDNKRMDGGGAQVDGGGAQVEELMEMIEQMMAEHRMDDSHVTRGAWSRADQLIQEISEMDTPPPISSKDTPPPVWTWTKFLDRQVLVSRLGLDGPWWTEMDQVDQVGFRVNLPLWFVSDDAEGQRSTLRCSTAVWALPPAQTRMPTEDQVHQVWTLRRSGGLRGFPDSSGLMGVPGSGGLRGFPDSSGLQDHQGGTSLEELEAFIDSYIQIWEQTMESCSREEPELDQIWDQRGDEVLTNIREKLSKLDVLEEIQVDLRELKERLENIQEFRGPGLKDPQSPDGSTKTQSYTQIPK